MRSMIRPRAWAVLVAIAVLASLTAGSATAPVATTSLRTPGA